MSDVAKPGRGRKPRLVHEENAWFESDGTINIEETQAVRRENGYTRDLPPNPPPKKVGKVDAKTICRRAVSELLDCGSWKTSAVLLFYIDSANRKSGNCWPSEETVVAKLGLWSTKAVSRANRYWCARGFQVDGELVPFLRVARKGRRRVDGTRESNAYHVGWLPLIALVANYHWDADLRAQAAAILSSIKQRRDKVSA